MIASPNGIIEKDNVESTVNFIEYPIAAIREMLLNALVHRNYMGTSIQIRLYDHKFSIWNEGILPEGIT